MSVRRPEPETCTERPRPNVPGARAPRGRTSMVSLVVLLLSALLFVVAVATPGPVTTRPIAATDIRHKSGHAYYVVLDRAKPPAPLLVTAGPDSAADGRSSTLRLRERGREIAPPHSAHETISSVGQGRFSHESGGWRSVFTFSTSDNSGSRSNGRAYAGVLSWHPARWIAWLAPALAVASIGLL